MKYQSKQLSVYLSSLLFTSIGWSTQVVALGESGDVCVKDFRSGAVCTANDVRIDDLIVVSVSEECAEGTPGETEVVFKALVSSDGSPNRYDIGMFLALDGGSARDGDSCYHDYLDSPLTSTPTYGDSIADGIPDLTNGPWWDGATDNDSCGDIEASTQLVKTLPSLRFACVDNNGDGSVDVSVAVSWDNNTGSTCNSVSDAYPGTNSKCSQSVGGVELGIAPDPALTIVKSPASQTLDSGEDAAFSFAVESNTIVSNVQVTDPLCNAAPAYQGGDTNGDTILTPDETWTYTCVKTNVTASFTNTARVTGSGPTILGALEDTDTAEVIVNSPPPAPAPAPAAVPVIGVAKQVTGMTDLGGGLWDVSLVFAVENLGSAALTDVQVTDDLASTFPAPVTFSIQAGPVASGTLTANGGFNGSGDINLLNAAASTLATGASDSVSLTVRFNLNGATGPFSNIAQATADSSAGTTSDTSDNGADPDTDRDGEPDEPGENDPTPIVPTVFLAPPAAALTKASTFDPAIHDNDGSGDLSPGDMLAYSVSVTNISTGDALDVVYNDAPDANTSLIVGSVTTTQGTVDTGNNAGDSSIQVAIGTLTGGSGATITYEVLINDPIPVGVTTIVNQGLLSGSNFTDVLSDDPVTVAANDATINQMPALARLAAFGIPVLPAWGLPAVILMLVSLVAWSRRKSSR